MYKALKGRLAYVYWMICMEIGKLAAAAEDRKNLAAAVMAADHAEEAEAFLNHMEIC